MKLEPYISLRFDGRCEAAFEFYEGAGHAFFNDTDRLGTHDEGHAKQAWERTVDFFKRHLGAKS